MERLFRLFEEAYHSQASDIHLSPGLPPMLRIHGRLCPSTDAPLSPGQVEDMARALLGEEGYQCFLEQGEFDLGYELQGLCRLRINVYRQRQQPALACRLISLNPPDASRLGLPDVVVRLAKEPQGLVLVTGPTGSGKSTTLAAMINEVNEKLARHIVTLEDPIEYVHPHKQSMIHQREIGQDNASFAQGLRAALRQDPDLILVGELRDLETIQTAITAAETGHLVLATLHTPNAPQTIDRLIDVFRAEQQQQIRLQLAGVLKGVIAQRLLPTKDGRGRIACFEILLNTTAVANLIRSEKVHQLRTVLETNRSLGMFTLEYDVSRKVREGLISPEVASEYVPEWNKG